MDEITQKYASFLKWYFLFILFEAIFLISAINKEFFLFKVLINYLFVLALAPLILQKINKLKIDLFSPFTIFTFFYLLLFGIKAIDVFVFHPDLLREDEKYYIQSLFYVILGLHFFQFGYVSRFGRLFLKDKKMISDHWSRTKMKIVLVDYSLISLVSILVIIKLSGGFSAYFSDIRNVMVEITSGKTILFISVLLIEIPLLIWFCYLLEEKKKSISFFLYFGFASLLLISVGERGHFITIIISLLICYHYLRKEVKLKSIIPFSIMLVLFLTLYGQYRDFTEQSKRIKKAGFTARIGISAVYHYFMGHFDQLRHVKDVIKSVPDEVDFQYGKTYLSLLVKPIPSMIWEGKPQGAGRIVTKTLYPKAYALQVTVAPSILAELFLNFHIIGIILGMFIFGVVCKILYLFLVKNYPNKNAVIIFSVCVPYIFSELRGDFNVVTSFLLFILIFLILTLNYISIQKSKI